ncbi:MAG: hypothetical protein AAF927_14010 [Bacteroidota bacterium]
MNHSSNFRFWSLFSGVLLLFSLTACPSSPCEGVNCANGSCDEITGLCNCEEGFEGADCSTSTRQKYLGTYQVSYDGCFTTSPNHQVLVEQADGNNFGVFIYDLGDYECPEGVGRVKLEATVDSVKMTIPEQDIDCGQIIYTFSGEGSIQGSILTISFQVKYDADGIMREDNCTASLEK